MADIHNISDDDRPLYRQVRDRIKGDLERGVWKPGDLLPTEAEMGHEFGVSSGTVRQAVLSLVRDGLLTRRAGKGTFVARIEGWRSFDRFFRFRDGQSGGEFRPEIRILGIEVAECGDAEVASRLQLSESDAVLSLRRLLVQDGTPVCLYYSYLPNDLVPHLEKEDLSDRLYPLLEYRFGIYVLRAEEFLRAVEANASIAEQLQVRKRAPVILIERTVYTFENRIVEFRRTYGRSDRFSYKIQLP